MKRGWKDKRKIKHNNYRTLQRTEILNEETNHSPLILHPKEIYSLKECPVFLDISIKTDIIYLIITVNICQARYQALGQGFTSIASSKPHTALRNSIIIILSSWMGNLRQREELAEGPMATPEFNWTSVIEPRASTLNDYTVLPSPLHIPMLQLLLWSTVFIHIYHYMEYIYIFLSVCYSSCFQLFHYYKCCCHEHLCI